MRRVDIQSQLLAEMREFFAAEGFKILKGDRAFVRPAEEKEDRVLPAPFQWVRGSRWVLGFLFQVRFPAVEDVLNACDPERRRGPKRGLKSTPTAVFNSINLRREDVPHPEITSPDEIPQHRAALEAIHRAAGPPLYERLRTIDDLLTLLDAKNAGELVPGQATPAQRNVTKVAALAALERHEECMAAIMSSRMQTPGVPSMAFLRNLATLVPQLELADARLEEIRAQTPLPDA